MAAAIDFLVYLLLVIQHCECYVVMVFDPIATAVRSKQQHRVALLMSLLACVLTTCRCNLAVVAFFFFICISPFFFLGVCLLGPFFLLCIVLLDLVHTYIYIDYLFFILVTV